MINSVVMLGPPGSGKSRIGKLVADRLGFIYVSSGDIARGMAIYDEATKSALMRGNMAPEARMREVLLANINHAITHSPGIVLDGCPRSIDQYHWLTGIVPSEFSLYVHMNASMHMCRTRLLDRMRYDDTMDIIEARLAYYYRDIAQVVPYIKNMVPESRFITVNNDIDDNTGSIDRIGCVIDKICGVIKIENSKDRSL